jgi:hypothetical protein
MSTAQRRLEAKIDKIRKMLMTLGPMRPGSISKQFRDPKEKRSPFYQISYTHRMKSRSEYVRPENLKALQRETAAFKRFRALVDTWVELALELSQLRIREGGTLDRS